MPKKTEKRVNPDIAKFADQVYAVGFKNGQIDMKNKALKLINTDWSLIRDASLMVKVLKKINSLKLALPSKTKGKKLTKPRT